MTEMSINEAALLAATGITGGRQMDCGSEHGKVCSDILHLKESDGNQWREINGMKRILLTSLGAIIVTMFGVMANLIITLAKTWVHP